MTNDRLISQILARDRKALYLFYQRYTPKLSRLIAHKISNSNDAEEVLQDTLMAFLEAIRDFHGKAKIETFLYAIANHKIIDYYRRKKIKHLVFSQMPQLESIVSTLMAPEEQLDATMLREKIGSALTRILPHYRKILTMKYIEGFSVGEIAHKLALSAKGAESQLFRARKAFVEIFLSI